MPHLALALTVLFVPGCGPEGGAASDEEASTTPTIVESEPDEQGNAEEPTGTIPDEIHFDLTAYSWYQQGQPLVHEGRSYMPSGDPLRVGEPLRRAGEYQGVSYYVPEDSAQHVTTLFVPVYYRYWQPFAPQSGV